MNNTLESHKAFPYVAWTVVILFAGFTYSLASGLQDNLDLINQDTQVLEASLLKEGA